MVNNVFEKQALAANGRSKHGLRQIEMPRFRDRKQMSTDRQIILIKVLEQGGKLRCHGCYKATRWSRQGDRMLTTAEPIAWFWLPRILAAGQGILGIQGSMS